MPDLQEQLRTYGGWVDDQLDATMWDGRSPSDALPASPTSSPPPWSGRDRNPAWRQRALALAAGVAVVAALAAGALALGPDDPTVETRGIVPSSGQSTSSIASQPTGPPSTVLPTPDRPGPIGPVDPCEPDPYATFDELRPALDADLPGSWWLTGSLWNRGMYGDRGVGVTWRDEMGRTLELEVVQVSRELHGEWMPAPGDATSIGGRPAVVSASDAAVLDHGERDLEPSIIIGWPDYDGSGWVVRQTTTGVDRADSLALTAAVDVEGFLAAQPACPLIDAPDPGELWTRIYVGEGAPGWVRPEHDPTDVAHVLADGTAAAVPVYGADRTTVVAYLVYARADGHMTSVGVITPAEVDGWMDAVADSPTRTKLPTAVEALHGTLQFPFGRG